MKRLLILIALLMSSVAWAGSTTVVVGQAAGGGLSCAGTPFAQQSQNSNTNYGSEDQKVANSSAITICRIDVGISNGGGTSSDFTVSVWSGVDGSGTQYGSTKSWTEPGGTSAHLHTVEWTSDYPSPTGDFHIYVTQTNDGGSLNGQAGYEGTSYFVRAGGTDFTDWDMQFAVYKME